MALWVLLLRLASKPLPLLLLLLDGSLLISTANGSAVLFDARLLLLVSGKEAKLSKEALLPKEKSKGLPLWLMGR